MVITWSGFFTPYNERKVRDNVPYEAGVYLLWVKLKEGKNWRCFYVGQAKDLEARLLEHLSEDEENECLSNKVNRKVCGFEYAEVGDQDNRDGIERYLYDQYKTECNEREPETDPIPVNLPD